MNLNTHDSDFDSDSDVDFSYSEPKPLDLVTILTEVGVFLQHNSNIAYKVIGGRAVTAWLDPARVEPQNLREHLITMDWDLVIRGDYDKKYNNKQAELFARSLMNYLSKTLNTKFEFRDTLSMQEDIETRIFQIGFAEGSKETHYIVDIHSEEASKYDKYGEYMFNNIRYPNLKGLINSLDFVINMGVQDKITKRVARKLLLKKAMEEIFMFNENVTKQLFKQCEIFGREQLTGYNMNCEMILQSSPQHKQKKFEELLNLKRKERMNNRLISEGTTIDK